MWGVGKLAKAVASTVTTAASYLEEDGGRDAEPDDVHERLRTTEALLEEVQVNAVRDKQALQTMLLEAQGLLADLKRRCLAAGLDPDAKDEEGAKPLRVTDGRPVDPAKIPTVAEYHQVLAAKEQLEIRLATNMDEVRRAIQDKSNAVRELYHEQQALLSATKRLEELEEELHTHKEVLDAAHKRQEHLTNRRQADEMAMDDLAANYSRLNEEAQQQREHDLRLIERLRRANKALEEKCKELLEKTMVQDKVINQLGTGVDASQMTVLDELRTTIKNKDDQLATLAAELQLARAAPSPSGSSPASGADAEALVKVTQERDFAAAQAREAGGQLADLQQKLQRMRAELAAKDSELVAAKQAAAAAAATAAAAANQSGGETTAESTIEQRIAAAVAALQEKHRAELSQLTLEHDKQLQTAKAEAAAAAAAASAAAASAKHSSDAEASRAASAAAAASMEQKLREQAAEISRLKQAHAAEVEAVKTHAAQEKQTAVETERAAGERKLHDALSALKSDLGQSESAAQSKLVAVYESKLAEASAATHAAELKLKQQHTEALDALKKQLTGEYEAAADKERKDAAARLQQALSAAGDSAASQSALVDSYEARLRDAATALEAVKRDHEAAIAQLRSDAAAALQEAVAAEHAAGAARLHAAVTAAESAAVTDKQATVAALVAEWENKLAAEVRAATEAAAAAQATALAAAQSQHTAALEAAVQAARAELTAQAADHEASALAAAESAFQQKLAAALAEAKAAAAVELDHKLTEANAEKTSALQRAAAAASTHAAKLQSDAQERLDSELAQLNAQHAQFVADLRATHQQELEQLTAKLTGEMEAALSTARSEAAAALEAAVSAAVAREQAQAHAALTEAQARAAAELAAASQAAAAQATKLESEKAAAVAAGEAAVASVRQEMQAHDAAAAKALDDAKAAAAAAQQQALAEAAAAAAQAQAAAVQAKAVEVQTAADARLTTELDRVQTEFNAAMASAVERTRAENVEAVKAAVADGDRRVAAKAAEIQEYKDLYVKEHAARKQIHNQLMEARGNIRVYCRVRPISEVEHKSGQDVDVTSYPVEDDIVIRQDEEGLVTKRFEFEKVFQPSSTQEQVFEEVKDLVDSAMDGYNVCIFAYGQTGSGKTYTMEGPADNRGVYYRALFELFDEAERRSDNNSYTFQLSMLEIYNEAVYDLLVPPSADRTKLEIRGDGRRVFVEGLELVTVASAAEVVKVLMQGSKNRAAGAHNMNEHSSRSHLVVCVEIACENRITCAKSRGKLNLIDLAGSERVGKTDATGDRLKEAQNINRSLSALGDVVAALATKNKHIPYRNSKLTYLLQDSLGGDAKVLMFVNVSPAMWNVGETMCSLNFAQRCRSIELGAAKRNVDNGEIARLRRQLAQLQDQVGSTSGTSTPPEGGETPRRTTASRK